MPLSAKFPPWLKSLVKSLAGNHHERMKGTTKITTISGNLGVRGFVR